ncbi:hypothetical protein L6452_38494 [Arctium lappa]|uniref:Uncharacterized protein n=1 Tax=Arctium lappa TaxID=4217 RepID=A0ACB8XQG1_ARCLA|nr:hypothetical protein L6452_38494 [Arctium lappa]
MVSLLGNSYSAGGGPPSQNQFQAGNNHLSSTALLSELNHRHSFDMNDFPQLTGHLSSTGGSQRQLGHYCDVFAYNLHSVLLSSFKCKNVVSDDPNPLNHFVHKELQDALSQMDAIRHEMRTNSFMNPGPLITRMLMDNVGQTPTKDNRYRYSLGNGEQIISSMAMGNLVNGGSIRRNLSSGRLNMPGIVSRLNLTDANQSGGLDEGVTRPSRLAKRIHSSLLFISRSFNGQRFPFSQPSPSPPQIGCNHATGGGGGGGGGGGDGQSGFPPPNVSTPNSDSFLESESILKFEPHVSPELSTLGTGFSSLKGCSELVNPPDDVKKHPVYSTTASTILPSSDMHRQATVHARLAESTAMRTEPTSNKVISELTDESGLTVLPVSAEDTGL